MRTPTSSKQRGGARPGAGVKAQTTDGGDLLRITVTLDATTIAKLRIVGDGNLSEGIRRAVQYISHDLD